MTILPGTENLFDYAACGLLLVDSQGVIRKVNATFCGWTGHDAGDLVDKKRFQDLFSMGGRVYLQTHWMPLMAMQSRIAELQLDVRHVEGNSVPMLFNAHRRLHDGLFFDEIAAFVVADRKAYEVELRSARRQAEILLEEKRLVEEQLRHLNQQLSDNDRQKDLFIATLAHELRNPLTPIALASSMIRKVISDASIERFATIIDRQTRHLGRLVDDALEISRISTGEINLLKTHTTLDAVIDLALDMALPQFTRQQQHFDILRNDDKVLLYCDETRIAQLLGNVLVNASKYTDAEGSIELEVLVDAALLTLRVKDNGIGIEAEKLPHIFDLFNQVDGKARRSDGGMGIGLALVRKIAELHGGSVAVQSTFGSGSVFTIELPVLVNPDGPI